MGNKNRLVHFTDLANKQKPQSSMKLQIFGNSARHGLLKI